MNDVVIDSSAAIAWVLADEPAHDAAVRFMGALSDGTFDPVFAAHFRFEVRHALVRAARRGRVDWADLPRWLEVLDALEATVAALSEVDEPVLELARRHQVTRG